MPSLLASRTPSGSIHVLAALLGSAAFGTDPSAQVAAGPTHYETVPIAPCPCPPAWQLIGNWNTLPLLHFLGTVDNKPLSIRVFNTRTMQYAYASNGTYHSTNVLGGTDINTLAPGTIGATVAGGGMDFFTGFDLPNEVHADFGTIGGGAGNLVLNKFSTVAGGESNTTSGDNATIAGGAINVASGKWSTLGGGLGNTISQDYATIGGGSENGAAGIYSTIGGGHQNSAAGDMSTVAGGHFNATGGTESTIGGGHANSANGNYGTVGGGHTNDVVADYGTIGGGQFNVVTASSGTIPGGEFNVVQGNYGFAAGRQARALHQGAFVWADSTNATYSSTASDQFSVRAAGGARIHTDAGASTGVCLASGGGAWTNCSDRAAKENIEAVDGREVLELLCAVPISTWNYKAQDDSIRHMGPMAQDFYAAFALGLGERTIDTVDPDGVALAAIQGLHALVQEQEATIAALEGRLAALEQRRN